MQDLTACHPNASQAGLTPHHEHRLHYHGRTLFWVQDFCKVCPLMGLQVDAGACRTLLWSWIG